MAPVDVAENAEGRGKQGRLSAAPKREGREGRCGSSCSYCRVAKKIVTPAITRMPRLGIDQHEGAVIEHLTGAQARTLLAGSADLSFAKKAVVMPLQQVGLDLPHGVKNRRPR